MFHDLPHWAFKLLGSLLGAAVLFLLLSLSHIPSAAHGDSQLALVHTTDTTLVPTSDWNLTLVNPWTPLPAGHTITVTHLRGGQSIDQRCYPALQAMMDACRAAGTLRSSAPPTVPTASRKPCSRTKSSGSWPPDTTRRRPTKKPPRW